MSDTKLKLLPASSTETLLEFCNKVREAGGAKPLDALLPGIPSDSQTCLIAKNLNFQCRVWGLAPHEGKTEEDRHAIEEMNDNWPGGDAWFMVFKTRKARDQVAEKLGLATVDACERQWAMLLPVKIGNVAANFDLIGEQYVSDFELNFREFRNTGLPKQEAIEKAHQIAVKPFTKAMKRYAKLTEVKDAP